MNDTSWKRWETTVAKLAQTYPYPPTPDIAAAVMLRLAARRPARRVGWAAAAVMVLALAAGLLAVPQVRAAVVEVLRLGGVRIFLVEPTPTAPAADAVRPPAIVLASVLDLAGETTLEAAQAAVDFAIPLPSYPADLGAPDGVFRQDLGAEAVLLVWVDAARPERIRLALMLLAEDAFVAKSPPQTLATTTVNGRHALWTEGPYFLIAQSGSYEFRRLIEGHVLIWEEDGITYRLETDLSLGEAVRIAESLKSGVPTGRDLETPVYEEVK